MRDPRSDTSEERARAEQMTASTLPQWDGTREGKIAALGPNRAERRAEANAQKRRHKRGR